MNSIFNDPGFWHRLQFGFTIVYHYLFPQLTMGLAWFIVYWKWRALRTGDDKYNQAVRFWAKSFGVNLAVGVVTGIPMEFQFGRTWACVSTVRSWWRRWWPFMLCGDSIRSKLNSICEPELLLV